MEQRDYIEGRYDTTYLDQLLAGRNGRSFSEVTEQDEELAAMAAALDTYLRSNAAAQGPEAAAAASGSVGLYRRPSWKQVARREALRG
jgi:hypothetical protein